VRALEARRVDGLVLTHHHEDHVGAAPLLRAQRGLVPRVHREGIPLLEHGFVQEGYRKLVWGRVPRFRAEALGDVVETGALRFRVLHTPGHSVDHVCLFEPERGWLFTGDLFLAERLRYLRSDEELDRLISSVEAATEVFCAHRGLVRNGVEALRRKADHLRSLRDRVLDLLDEGLPEREIARRVIGPEGPMTWFSLGRFSVRNFVRSLARERRH
jgi:ribonuclease/clavin/mitogillin